MSKVLLMMYFQLQNFSFFSFVAEHFKPLLTSYQTDAPMVPYLYQDLKERVLQLLSLVIKPSVINSYNDNLCELDATKKGNRLPLNSVNIGFASEGMLSKLLQKDKVTLADVTLFKEQCVVFVVNIIQQMSEKSPLSNHFVKYSSCFRPDEVLDNPDGHLMMKKLLRSLVNLKILKS